MTLILTAGCSDFVLLVSDRRFSRVTTDGTKTEFVEPASDEANKALVVASYLGSFAVAFTGRADIAGDTGTWLLSQASESNAASYGMAACAKALRDAAEKYYKNLPAIGQADYLEFVLTGFSVTTTGPQVRIVTNLRQDDFEWLSRPTRTFKILRPSNAKYPYWEAGCTRAMPPETSRRIHSLLKKSPNYPRVADVLVKEIRQASQHTDLGKWIGMNCMSIFLSKSGQVEAVYHPAHVMPVAYAPNFIQVKQRKDGTPWQMVMGGMFMAGNTGPVVLGDNALRVLDRRGIIAQ